VALADKASALAPSDAAYWSKELFWWLLCLLVACWLCAWLKPGTDLASSAARAFDSSVLLLSHGGTDPAMSDDNSEDDEDSSYRQRRPARSLAPKQPAAPFKTSAFRKRVTPLLQKRIAARYGFKCAICGMPFTDQSLWEIDHIAPLSSARTAADVARLNDISNLQPVHRSPCHQMKTSREAARR
jgi:5-methylcytosine-specific restriction endonuclease McrA